MKEIKQGDKTIKLSIKFWTNNLPTNNLKVAWNSGVVHVMANRSRGIRSMLNPIHFNSLDEKECGKTLIEAIIEVLKHERITLLKPGKEGKKEEILF